MLVALQWLRFAGNRCRKPYTLHMSDRAVARYGLLANIVPHCLDGRIINGLLSRLQSRYCTDGPTESCPFSVMLLYVLSDVLRHRVTIVPHLVCQPQQRIYNTHFSDQFWTICMHFGKSAANFDIAAAESYPTGRRTDETPKLPALFPKCMHCRLNWPEKGVDRHSNLERYVICL